jgi:signal transduction histidine kinase
VLAATAFTWRNAETFARERLLRTAELYTIALEKGARHAGPGALSRLEEFVADALGADLQGVALVDQRGAVRAAAGALPDADLGRAPWVLRATRDGLVGTAETDGGVAVAVPTWIGCRPPRRPWGRFRGGPWRGRAGVDGPPGQAPSPTAPAAASGGPTDDARTATVGDEPAASRGANEDPADGDLAPAPPGPPPFDGRRPPPGPPDRPGPSDCPEARWAVVLQLDPTLAWRAVHQARLQAAAVVAVLLVAWALAGRWRRAQQRAEQLTAEARRREHLAALGELAAVLAHEIRNPLGAIRGHAQLAAARLPEDERGRRSLETVVAETTRLSALVEALLRYARPQPPTPRATDVGALAARVTELLRVEATTQHVALAVEAPPTPTVCPCDPDQLEQVLWNLLRNAVQSQPDGGHATVRVRRAPGAVVVRVEDGGPGVPPADRDRIFAPFVTTRAEGSGLGLAIARQIAEAHGGTLTVGAVPGGGAAFELALPCPAGVGAARDPADTPADDERGAPS